MENAKDNPKPTNQAMQNTPLNNNNKELNQQEPPNTQISYVLETMDFNMSTNTSSMNSQSSQAVVGAQLNPKPLDGISLNKELEPQDNKQKIEEMQEDEHANGHVVDMMVS